MIRDTADDEKIAQAEALAGEIDTLIAGKNIGVIIIALCAVLGRGVVLVEEEPEDRDKLVGEVLKEIQASVQHFADHPEYVQQESTH